MVDGSRWKPILGADQRRSAKEVLCLRPWSQDGWPSFRLAHILLPLSSMFVIGSSYVSSLRSHVICIASSYLFVREMSDLLLRTSSHCPSHHYIHY